MWAKCEAFGGSRLCVTELGLTLADRAVCRAAEFCEMHATVAGEADLVGDMRTGVNANGSDLAAFASAKPHLSYAIWRSYTYAESQTFLTAIACHSH